MEYRYRKQLDALCLIYNCDQAYILKTVGSGPYYIYVGGEAYADEFMGIPIIHDPALPYYTTIASGVKD